MFTQNPTDQTKKDQPSTQSQPSLFGLGQTQLPINQKKQTMQSSSNISNPSQNIEKSKQNVTVKPANPFPNQEQKSKQTKLIQNQNKTPNKQSTGGGVLRPGGKQDQKRDSLAIDTTLHFGLQDIIDSMLKQKKLDGRQLDKIVKNFKLYVKSDGKPFSLQKVSQVETKIANKPRILKLPYLNQIEDKSKITINQFWISMLESVCQKVPFLSEEACLEIMKLQISMNKHIYCQKGNFGNFEVQLFAKPHLFPIINNKMQVNTQHQFYISIQTQIIDLFLNLFKALHKIFREMSQLKIDENPKYKKIFQSLEENQPKKKQVLKNLIDSFFSILKHTRQQKFNLSLPYLQCIADSIWYFYLAHKGSFDEEICKSFLNKLNQNFSFFNESGKTKSSNLKNLINSVQKISISFLLSEPFNYQRWQDQSLKAIILESNLEMLQPFKMILPSNKRQERYRRIQKYETRGFHWKEFIEIMIKLEEDDEQTIGFIIQCIKSFFAQNSELFWEEPIQFKDFYQFTGRLLDKKSNQFYQREDTDLFLEILGIGSKLMGDQKQKNVQRNLDFIEGKQYPQTRALPFTMRVHNQFSNYFLRMNKQQFLDIIRDQLIRMIENIREKGTYEYEQERELNLRRELLLKEFVLKLISSEASLFFSIFKTTPDIKEEQLMEFLIFSTITNPSFPSNIVDVAFVALDKMLVDFNTRKLVQNVLSLDNIDRELSWSANQVFQNIKVLPFIARHCGILINLNYEQKRWTQQLLRKFYEFSIEEGRKLFSLNSVFAKSYYQLLSHILALISTRGLRNISSLRPFINISFIIDSLKYYLKFDFYRGDYVNIAVCEQNPHKIESLLECVRLYNIILIHELQLQTTTLQNNSQSNVKKTNSYLQSEDNRFLTPFEAKQLGICDKQFSFQVKSVKNETTSYLNSLSFILVSSTSEQKKILKQINYDYESLILQTIQTLAKLNGKTNLRSHFEVVNPRISNIADISRRQVEHGWCLKKLVSYVQNSLNHSGIQIIVFGDLIQKTQRLRSLIDKVRSKIQNPKIRDRMSTKLTLKLISTLARYFRDSMARMALNKDKEFNFGSFQIRDHFEYLLQTVVETIVALRVNNQNWQQTMMRNILSNIYGGILNVQNFNGLQFLKLLKNFHPILLNSINLNYLFNMIDVDQLNSKERYQIRGDSPIVFDENYFKLIQLFFNCEQYLTQQQFKIIKGIKQLPERLQYFIQSIVKYSQFSKLPEDFINILLQILVSGVSFFMSVSNSQQQKIEFSSSIHQFIIDQKHRIQPSVNLVLLELLLSNQIFLSYQASNLSWENQQILPLQIISIDSKLPFRLLEQILTQLRKPALNNMAFLSIATGLFSYIQRSEDEENQSENPAFLLKSLLEVYNQLLRIPQSNVKQFYNASLYSPQSPQMGSGNNWNSPYKNIWTLQLILAILTNIQAKPTFQKGQKQKQFENLLIQNDGILKRFGLIMKKIGIQESETYLPWLPFLEQQIEFQLQNKNQVSFVQKLELYQIMKIFSFLFANTDWHSSFVNKHVELISVLVQYRKVFEKLCFSGKKHKGQSPQEKILESISLGSLLATHDVSVSEANRFERQKIGGNVLKSSNCFELLHQVINFQLSLQYTLLCSSVGIPFCYGLSRKLPELADISRWNTLFQELAQSLVQKYIQVLNEQHLLNKILGQFSQIYNGNSQYNIALSKQMMFTNSASVSCCLDVSLRCWKSVLIESLCLVFESIYTINRKLQTQLHSDFKSHQQKFNSIITLLKRHDKQSFDYALYDSTQQKNKLSQTIRSNYSRNVFNSMINPFSQTVRNY